MWKIKNSQKLFYAAYFIYIAGMFMDVLPDILYVDTEMLKKTFKMISMVLLVIRFCFFVLPRGFDLKNLIGKGILKYFTVQKIFLVIIFSFTLLLGLMSKNFYLLALIMFGLNMQEFRMRELFSVSFCILVFLTGMTILLCFLGGVPNIRLIRDTSYHYGKARYTLGFVHSLVLPGILVYVAAYFYTIRKKVKVSDFIIFQGLGILVFYLCDSRNGIIALEFLLWSLLVWQLVMGKAYGKRKQILEKVLTIMASAAFLLITIFSLFLLWGYSGQKQFAIILNSVLSNRVMLALLNFDVLPFQMISVLSQQEFSDVTLHVFDNGYYYLLARYGYVVVGIFIITTIMTVAYMKKKENYYAMITYIVIALLNFIDNGMVSYIFFPYMLCGIHSLYYSDEKS